ncbi:hypothetical protein N7449_007423 [Penicillium cf. viridicatum]|uniref:Uncharacterized protein n=1 Tax=Penicillium cf. viridicatum TaxID=2972119 RepID=A0A9W9MCN3_9EURO|nr:hypothetical protein N7449_007423 [Penicillium cf. viridicatum]
MSSRRSYNAPSSQELAVVGNLHGQPAERIGGIMLMIYAMLPAPGRSNDVPKSQELAAGHAMMSAPRRSFDVPSS